MLIRKLLAVSLAAASLAGISSAARAHTDVVVNFAPPAPRYETVPAVRVGYVWAPGYWDYRGNRHHWVKGRYIAARPGYVYHSAHWARVGNHWRYDQGYWGHASYHAH